jgi:hypothetical protein
VSVHIGLLLNRPPRREKPADGSAPAHPQRQAPAALNNPTKPFFRFDEVGLKQRYSTLAVLAFCVPDISLDGFASCKMRKTMKSGVLPSFAGRKISAGG